MESEILKDLQSSIEKNLPAQVGDVLKKVLEQGKIDAAEVKNLRSSTESYLNEISEMRSQLTEYRKFDDRNATLDAREKQLNAREIELQVKELQYQLASEKEKTDFAKSVALGLVRNTEYRRDVFNSESVPFAGQYGTTYETKTNSSNETNGAD